MNLSYRNSRLRRLYYHLPPFVQEGAAVVYALKQQRQRFGGAFATQLNELQEHAGRSPAEVAADQLRRLRATLAHAAACVPYYSGLLREAGIDVTSIESLDDLRRMPLLDKETIRAQQEQLQARPPIERTILERTSGTTGKPLNLLVTEEANQRHYACHWFHFSWAGYNRGDRLAHFGGHPVAPADRMRPPFWVLDRLNHDLIFSSYHITPRTLSAYVEALAHHEPVLIYGYPSAIYLIALHLLDTARTDIRPKGVFTWAETTLPHQRAAIEQAFGCRVYSSYGNSERAGNLLQCEAGNFHVVTEACVVEVLLPDGRPAAPGEVGELVCTGLTNLAMPLIRYRVGDAGIPAEGPCPCGRSTPILADITGRLDDFIVTPDGRHVTRLASVFWGIMTIQEAQFVQEEVESVCVKIVPRPGFSPSDQAHVLDGLRAKLGSEIEIKIQLVDAIPRTGNGKLRGVISSAPLQISGRTSRP